jgi:hypothetical protein
MTKTARVGALLFAAISSTGCAGLVHGGNGYLAGGLYSGYKMSGVVGEGSGNKTGQACASSILGLVATGDASIAAAKEDGGISEVAHVDHDNFQILGLYATTCTVVTGR